MIMNFEKLDLKKFEADRLSEEEQSYLWGGDKVTLLSHMMDGSTMRDICDNESKTDGAWPEADVTHSAPPAGLG